MNKTEKILRAIISWSVYAVIFFTPLYFAVFHENYTIFDLNKSVILRLFISVALIAWLALGAFSGRLIAFTSKKMSWALILLLASFLISSLLSLHPMISLLGSYERQQGFINLLPYILFFFFLTITITSKEKLHRALIVANLSAAFICVYGLMQIFGLDFLRWAESSQQRIFSSFGQPNFFGHYLVVMLPLTLYSIFFVVKRWYLRLSLTLLVLAQLICLAFTFSRSAWVAFAASVIVAGLLYMWRRNKIYAVTALGIFLLTFTLLLLAPVRSQLLKSVDYDPRSLVFRAVTIFDYKAGSAGTRLFYWSAAWDAFKHAPLYRKAFGFGPDVQASVFVREYKPEWAYYERMNSFPDRAHNAPLDFLLQFGLFGLAVFVSLLIVIIVPCVKKFSHASGQDYWLGLAIASALLAYAVNNLFSFSLTALAVMLFFLLAIAWSYGRGDREVRGYELGFFQPASRAVIAGAATVLLGVLFYGYGVRPLVADGYYMKVKKAEARGDCRVVLDGMEKVLEWYPVSHYYARIYLHHGVNCFSAASSDVSKRQISRNLIDQAMTISERETQFYTLIDLAHTYSVLGYYTDTAYYESAEQTYRRLLDINRFITVTYQDYARMKLWQGDNAAARTIIEQGIEITPLAEQAPILSGHTPAISRQRAYFHDLLGLSYFSENNFEAAALEYKKALAIDPTLTSAYQKLADMAYQLKDSAGAISYTAQAFTVDPNNSAWPLRLAALYKEEGNSVSARFYADIAMQLDPNNEQTKKLLNELNNDN